MGLVVKFKIGEVAKVGPYRLKLEDIVNDYCIVVSLDGSPGVQLSESQAEELAPNVFVSIGKRGTLQETQINIDAPREYKIDRPAAA